MTRRSVAMMAAGSATVASSTAAALLIWLLLTRPFDLVNASGHDVDGFVNLAAATLYEMLRRIPEFL
jgi:hypothetical protein